MRATQPEVEKFVCSGRLVVLSPLFYVLFCRNERKMKKKCIIIASFFKKTCTVTYFDVSLN